MENPPLETPPVADAFLELLERSALLSAEQIGAAAERLKLRGQTEAREVAKLLIRDGQITRFQAERLLEGRYRGFFIEHYKVLEILGAGGMACLYLAEDTRNGQQVALKVMSDKHKTDAGMLARLKLEAHAGKKLKHSGIVRTFSIGVTDDVFGEVHYLVMEFVRGVNLEELINLRGAIPWQQAADFMLQAATGLQHAHSTGMVHRDVKPGNLIVDAQGSTKILDFGLALMDSAEADEFSLAMIFGHNCLGTADYIAPEQTYDSFSVDARADIYSLGCMLYVALTAKLPYPITSTIEKLEGHRHREAPPLRGIVPEVPAELAMVVEKMMSKKPDDRHQTMAEVIEALAPFARRMPVEFDFPQVLAWRAKEARRRFGAGKRSGLSTSPSSTAALRGLSSTSTKRLPQASSADTDVDQKPRRSKSAVSLVAPFDGAASSPALSRSDVMPIPVSEGPALVALDDGEAFPLTGETLVIGRDAECDVRIPSSSVSGRHCELRFDGSRWTVYDCKSKNGILVNGAAVIECVLQPGDRLTVARQHHFRVDYTITPIVDTGRLLHWALAGAIVFAVSLSGLFLWRMMFAEAMADPYTLDDGIYRPSPPVRHRDDEYDASGFDVLREMQARHFWYRGRHRFVLHALRRALRESGRESRALRMIDLGGGCGGWIRALLDTGFDATELAVGDSSLEALRFTTQVLPESVGRYQIDLMRLDWHERWDVVFLLDVLEHIPDHVEALEQIAAALAPGGLLVITTPALERFRSWNDELAHHVRRYSIADFRELAAKCGFELFDARYFMFFLSPLLIASRWLKRPDLSRLTFEERRALIARTHRVPGPVVNGLLSGVFCAETPLGHCVRFPWGTSVLAVFRKPE